VSGSIEPNFRVEPGSAAVGALKPIANVEVTKNARIAIDVNVRCGSIADVERPLPDQRKSQLSWE
jgi:hypothetical protein